jgi:hypothetical protein
MVSSTYNKTVVDQIFQESSDKTEQKDNRHPQKGEKNWRDRKNPIRNPHHTRKNNYPEPE